MAESSRSRSARRIVVIVGAILVWIQFYTPIIKTAERSLYVTLWYFSAGFIWLGLTYIMGNFFPQYLVAGNAAGPLLGLYIHDLVGLWVTPMGWGMMYYIVPIILKKPIWSHGLSLVGFWGLAFFYPLQGIHHFLYTPIPMFLQYGAVISTIAVEFVVATVVITATLFQRLKRNRPDGYYQQRFVIWLDDRGFRRAPFVRRTGSWDIGRTFHAPLPPRD